MATYIELATLYSRSILNEQITVAIAIAAQNIIDEPDTTPNHSERFKWAAKATGNPGAEADRFLIGVLAANHTATVSQIENATDTQVQNNVDALVNVFALADAGT